MFYIYLVLYKCYCNYLKIEREIKKGLLTNVPGFSRVLTNRLLG